MDITPLQFEKLLVEFCKQDLPPDFTIEHDVKDIGSESGNDRQIDTKIKGRLGVSNILICGEAKNWASKVCIETIDGLVGKYMSGELRANKVILFSNRGFTEPAERRAKLLGIELLQPYELGKPVRTIPIIVAVGYLGRMVVRITYDGSEKNLVGTDKSNYIILKGREKLSFEQNVFRLAVIRLKQSTQPDLFSLAEKLEIKDGNVLYELRTTPGKRYNAHFDVDLSLRWDYFIEYFPMGLLTHLNSGEKKLVNLQGAVEEILNKVLLSNTKLNYESKEECIKEIVEKNPAFSFFACMTDPDQQKVDPRVGKLVLI